MSSDEFKKLLEMLNIKKFNSETKCWLVRCEKHSRYYDNFKEYGIAAIGHIDALGYKSVDDFLVNPMDAEIKLTERIASQTGKDKTSAKRTAKVYVNQALTFIDVIKEDDIIITVGKEKILVGYATKYIALDDSELRITGEDLKGKHYNIIMNLSLRRDIIWEHEVDKDRLPPSLFKTLMKPQTVAQIKEIHSVLHMVHPMYIYDNKNFHFSVNINQKDSLNNRYISQLFSMFDEMEYIIKSENINESTYDDDIACFDDFSLSTRASFMSPGEAWAMLALNYKEMATAIVIYSMIFGNSKLGFDGIIDKEIRHMIASKLLNKKYKKMKDNLELEQPSNEIELK
ncbi:hypothetical protein CRV02_13570 [Arcobacter sp. CECT 8989]|uniref:hypothetical protein n=1 Tax=Arcobacter sp. CECT 8989 TaxID=2044509 RepID=UPI00100BAFD6|nr:hypothetical protein [Arcobacter sp. CECT 8989]RXJ98273.1 hypothetical protein CRV02_13570 [Arcobacter sp. CECT 8989]